jgi:CrcB protein
VNVIGCFAIGFLGGLGDARQSLGTELRLVLLIGLLGGFTTFSAFGYETLALARSPEPARAVINVTIQLIAGLLAVWTGYILGRS